MPRHLLQLSQDLLRLTSLTRYGIRTTARNYLQSITEFNAQYRPGRESEKISRA
jgi:hypothetical protein